MPAEQTDAHVEDGLLLFGPVSKAKLLLWPPYSPRSCHISEWLLCVYKLWLPEPVSCGALLTANSESVQDLGEYGGHKSNFAFETGPKSNKPSST